MNRDYLISNQTYDSLKRLVTVILPGLAALYAILTALWDVPNPLVVLGTLGALALLGGLLMAFSTLSWSESAAKYDGVLSIARNDPDTGMPEIQLNITRDPNELVKKSSILFKSVDERRSFD